MNVAVVKYNAGNVLSVMFAIRRLGLEPVWTDDPEELRSADRVIFPGQGEASSAMAYLRARGLDEVLTGLSQPVLGICLGLQLMCRWSEENDTRCLGILPHDVRLFDDSLKVPHVGWNAIDGLTGSLFGGVDDGAFAYFAHSYYVETGENVTAFTDYSTRFASAVQVRNFQAVQFHPEKSGEVGERILRNFLSGAPAR
jgi:glutamine amidotransferase